ncbi:MAG: 50S ribosomal protein L17 [Candidatus Cloacimonetes bacterium]|nr:50S ribosomal protein L17 [Candidatus Cloacimonadota bacterium]MCF7814332.1 50S ribosomal protein L17 [Candidatus Cloacimonadota bacterium]MCF7868976.1 50S ribosomal protein L17 [Candidatus Cloacimonadota bacterium]MCF7884370.1 50S ribosomal protein L17 [Candidatus Cloacimonadota bacterium]
MRHRVSGRKFGLEKDHREAMMRNLVISLVEYGSINTTLARAKEVRGLAERMITHAKKDTIHYRRQVYKVLKNRDLVKKVFDEIAPKMAEREGGYTRVLKNGYRKGDMAPMAIIEFVGNELETKETKEKKKK